MSPAPDIVSRLREILLQDWDPHIVSAQLPETAHAYDTYIHSLIRLLEAGADEDALVQWLHEREKESMCFPSLGTGRLRRVARKLLALRDAKG